MLAKAQGGIEAYNAMRVRLNEKVGSMINDIGDLASRVAASSQEMTASSQQTGMAIEEIARASSSVAEGAELLRDVWDSRAGWSTRTVDSHAHRLSGKLAGAKEPLVLTVRGVGYRLLEGTAER